MKADLFNQLQSSVFDPADEGILIKPCVSTLE